MEFDPSDANETDWPQAYPQDWFPGNIPGYQGLVGGVPVDTSEKMKYSGPGTGNFGPHCRNCHRGSSDCAVCHEAGALASSNQQAAMNKDEYGDYYFVSGGTWFPKSTFDALGADLSKYWRHERSIEWDTDWRTSDATTTAAGATDPQISTACSNDGFSWPHRTMGFKLLKDEMWGLDFDGSEVAIGETRSELPDYISSDGNMYKMVTSDLPSTSYNIEAQDLDSVCLDCHDPNVWNASSYQDHVDSTTDTTDDYDDELLLRGLP